MGVAGIDRRARLRAARRTMSRQRWRWSVASTWTETQLAPASRYAGERRLGLLDHQVHVERQARRLAEGPDDRRPDRQVRHEVAVHDVHVDEVRSACLRHRQGVRQAREVRREQRRRDRNSHERGAAGVSGGRETVSETTSRLESG